MLRSHVILWRDFVNGFTSSFHECMRCGPRGARLVSGSVRRVWVVGTTGSGKSWLARALATALGVRHVELDAIYHQPEWTPLPPEQFRLRVAEAVSGDRWVIDGNYQAAGELVLARADTVVWFDLPRRVVMRQLTRRTLRRMRTREVLWNGNREDFHFLFSRDPEVNILLWAWQRHEHYRQRYAALAADPAYAHITFARVPSRRAARELVDRVRRS